MENRLVATALGLATAVSVAGIATAAPAKPEKTNGNIVQTAVAAGKFTTLVSLVKKAGLAGTLSGSGSYTVFAPTDAAFAKVPKATLAALGSNKAKLKAVLLYHVAKGKVTAGKVVKRKSVKTLQGDSLAVKVKGSNVFVGKAKVVAPDVMASNGVIHVVNSVLIPPAG